MSTARLFFFDSDNEIVDVKEYQNSWGGAAYIWSHIFDKYLKEKEYDSWIYPEENSAKLWKLAYNKTLPFFVRACLFFTFDKIIVKKENFSRLAKDLDEFIKFFNKTTLCHLPQWIQLLNEPMNEKIAFMASWHTSVSGPSFMDWNNELEKYEIKPDLVDLYEELDQI